ncbi:MAG: glycosyl hydrolase 115 family protein [Prevotella sp.]|nr:glycosyl hydrolase 115 family protein [Prevotella sp.]
MRQLLLTKKIMVVVMLALAMSLKVKAADAFIVFEPASGAWELSDPSICIAEGEHSCVRLAAANLATDFGKVTGTEATITSLTAHLSPLTSKSILIGTVGTNKQIDQWVKQGVLRDLKGKTEKYIIKTIGNQLVIAGSDKRGTVYGIYELSRQIGVSPWYYWADVPVEKHTSLYIKEGEYTDGEPAVRYRGLFLNDEAPCLTTWVKNTFGTDFGGHKFYEKVFELILRLKGNYLWPAMWGWAFYADDPENLKTADAMGVMMGTSHHEPMARNHQEYARDRKGWGAWNYSTNKQNLDRFFREGIERMKGTDDIVTIGMRGDGDEAMGNGTDTKLLESIINNQRRIIKEVTGKSADKTPQIWALYKEVQDYYDAGLRVPDDVTVLLCDDNWGNVRRLPTAEEQKRKGGWGLYYHVDYVGAPRNSKWINVTPIQNMWEQLQLAYNGGIQKLWILNVGDLKPMEYPIQLFMDMAWDPTKYHVDNLLDHTRDFCAESFGKDQACEATQLLNLVSKYNGRITSEMLDAKTYTTTEFAKVVADYQALEARALRQFITLKPEAKDAYRQIILFPIQAMGNIYEMYYAQAMNHELAAKGDPDANCWAERCRKAFERDQQLNLQYNKEIAGGKWDGMMIQKHISYKIWNDNYPADVCPDLIEMKAPAEGPTFSPRDGYISIEAEHTWNRQDASQAQWTVIPYMGRTLSGIALMPYTVGTDNASLTYRFSLTQDTSLTSIKVRIITKSTLDFLDKGGLVYDVAIDGGQPVSVNFNANLNEKPENIYSIYYPTVASRVVEKEVELPLSASQDIHTLTLHPQDPGIVFEKIVIDLGGYQPQFLFGEESPKTYQK